MTSDTLLRQEACEHAAWGDGKLKVLVVCFGGNYEGLSWRSRLQALGVNFLHLQDSKFRWYLEGADGAAGPWDTIRKIKDYHSRLPGLPLVTLGQSSGGYAALRYGLLLGADLMIAFAPQTHFLIPRPLFKGQSPLYPPRDLIDVRPDLNATTRRAVLIVGRSEVDNPPTQYFLDDLAHLDGIQPRDNVRIVTQETDTHTVAREMARAGVLDDFLLEHISALKPDRTALLAGLGRAAAGRCRAVLDARRRRW